MLKVLVCVTEPRFPATCLRSSVVCIMYVLPEKHNKCILKIRPIIYLHMQRSFDMKNPVDVGFIK